MPKPSKEMTCMMAKTTKGESPMGVAFVTLNEKYNGYRY